MTVSCSTVRFTHAHTWAPILAPTPDFPSGKSGEVRPVRYLTAKLPGDIQDYEDPTKVRNQLPFSIAIDKYFRNHFCIDLVQTRVRALRALSGLEIQGYLYHFRAEI